MTTHASDMRNLAPVSALATRSPMSTNPPIAVRIPSVISRSFFKSGPGRRHPASPKRPRASSPIVPPHRSPTAGPQCASGWFQPMDAPRPQRNRIHIDVWVPHDQADVRVAAAIAAGGHLVTDRYAPSWWTLADTEGNEADVCTWQAHKRVG